MAEFLSVVCELPVDADADEHVVIRARSSLEVKNCDPTPSRAGPAALIDLSQEFLYGRATRETPGGRLPT